MSKYKLPAGAIESEIKYLGPWYGGKPCLIIPFYIKPSRDQVKEVGDVLAQIVKDDSPIPQDVRPIKLDTPNTGRETLIENMEYDFGFEVVSAGKTSPILHLPSYQVYLAKGGEGFVQEAQGVVMVLPKDKSCKHCVDSLEYIADLLKPSFSDKQEDMVMSLPKG